MERRNVLAAAAAASVALLPIGANAYEGLPDDVGAALARFRRSIPDNFDRTYIENAVIPFRSGGADHEAVVRPSVNEDPLTPAALGP